MPRRLGLVRPFALLIAVLVLTILSAAPASASDKTLRATVISAAKQLERAAAALEMPDDEESPSFAAEYKAGMRKLDGFLARYGRRIAAEHGSSSAGRRARKLLLRSTGARRESFALVAKMALAESEPSKRDLDRAARLDAAAARDHRQAIKLLKLKLRPPVDAGTVTVTPDSSGVDDDSDYDDEYDYGDDQPDDDVGDVGGVDGDGDVER